ncbi:hypothetical protein LFL97_39135 (plasmid) [Burkholderia sp. JSH-S8]|nr:hypothetical protein LFL97_39135 [Burkholderia sp. JSH-S8]
MPVPKPIAVWRVPLGGIPNSGKRRRALFREKSGNIFLTIFGIICRLCVYRKWPAMHARCAGFPLGKTIRPLEKIHGRLDGDTLLGTSSTSAQGQAGRPRWPARLHGRMENETNKTL